MRALVLLLVCVFALASVQAAYSGMEASSNNADSKNKQLLKHHRKHDRSHHQKHHTNAEEAYTETLNRVEDHHHQSSHEDTNAFKSYKDTSRNTIHSAPTKSYSTSTPKNYGTYKMGYYHGNTINDIYGDQQSKLRIRVERIDDTPERNRHDTRSKGSRYNKDHASSGMYEKAYIEKNPTTQLQKHSYLKNRRGSELHHHSHMASKTSCNTDADCKGGCCIHLKNGKSKCKIPNFRNVGEKCASTCVCKEGFQCFVNILKKNGQKRIINKGKRTVGHCMTQSMADFSTGFFLPSFKNNTNAKV